jgi:hypothetical protein
MNRYVATVALVAACEGGTTGPRVNDAARPIDAPWRVEATIEHGWVVDAAPDPDPEPEPKPPVDAPPPIDEPPDPSQLPDLTLVAARMNGTAVIIPETFTPSSCEVVEACVEPGTRRLLRFDVASANLGGVDLVMGPPPPAGVSVPPYTWSPCHMHHHVEGFAAYELVDGNGSVVEGRKQAFCLMDVVQVTPGAPSQGYTCANQGISVGWADVYTRGLPCQWIDVTGVPPGTYTLRIEVNPDGLFEEGDRSNNVWTQVIQI